MMASPKSISVYLENLDLKKNSLRKAILLLAAEWKYLDEHLDLTKECFSDCVTGLESERKRLESIRDSVTESNRELEVIRESLEARQREVECKEERFLSFQQEQLKDFEMKEEQLAEIRTWVVERIEEGKLENKRPRERKKSMELLLKQFQIEKNEFEDIKKAIGEKLNEISLKEKNIDDRSKELHLLQDWVERRAKVLDSKEEELEVREQLLKAMQQCFVDVQDKSKQLKDEKQQFEECCKEFESKEKQLEERCKNFESIFKQFEERSNDLVLKEAQLEERSKEVELKEKHFEERTKDRLVKETPLEEQTKGFELKQLQKRNGQKTTKHDYDVDGHRKHSEESRLVSSVISPCHPKRSISALGSTSPFLSPLLANMDGNNLLFFLSKHVEVHELMGKEIYVALRTSYDPGKLVLNATQGFLSPVLMELDIDIDVHALRSCIFLLEILMSLKPVISSQVIETSRRLAIDWKLNAGLREENSLLSLGFSRFVSAYGLTSAFDPDELLNTDKHTKPHQNAFGCSEDMLARNVPEYKRKINQPAKDLQLCGVPEFVWRASHPAKFVLDAIEGCYFSKFGSHKMGKLEILKSLNFLLSRLLKVQVEVTDQIKEQAMKIAADWKAKVKRRGFSEIRCFLLFLATYKVTSSCDNGELVDLLEIVFSRKTSKVAVDLLHSLGLGDEVPNFIIILVERGMHLDAIKYVCAFELGDKFPPATLLKGYISYEEAAAKKIRKEGCYSVTAKDNAINKELDALKAVVNCSRQHKLESQYPLQNIEARIKQLQRQRLAIGSLASSSASKAQLKKRDDSWSEKINKKKRKGFVTEHSNNAHFHPLRSENLPRPTVPKLPYQHLPSIYPLQSPPCLIPHEGYYCSVGSAHDPPYMSRSSSEFGNNDDFGHPPNFETGPGALSEILRRYLPSVGEQMHWY